MASITDLYTREECNDAKRVHIGGQWLEYLGTDSDAFTTAKRQIQLDSISGKVKNDEISETLVAALITSWSFDEECNTKNKIELLKNSPSLCEQIDKLASARSDFVKKLQTKQSNTQGDTSGNKSQSSKPRKRKSAAKTTTRK